MSYDTEKAMVGKIFIVKEAWEIGNCKMKVGDVLTVTDYGSGSVSHYVSFTNPRLIVHTFKTGTWYFQKCTEELCTEESK